MPRPQPVHELTLEKPFGPSQTLQEFLDQSLEQQFPAQGPALSAPKQPEEYFIELVREPVVVHLAAGVRTYAAGPSGLAAGLDNGDIRIWSDWPCPAVTLPEAGPLAALAWDGAAPFLGAAEEGGLFFHLYDLRLCAHVDTVELSAPVKTAALSASGQWAAVVDQDRGVRIGPVQGEPLPQAGVLRFQPLALAFSPREGVLFSVDQAGWIVHWAVPDRRVLDQRLIPGGPFRRAHFQGRFLLLEPTGDGAAREQRPDAVGLVWDIPVSRVVQDKPAHLPYDLENGLLTYQPEDARWLRKMHLGRPVMRVWAAASSKVFQVHDLDGQTRCYSAADGLIRDPEQCRGEDWEELAVDAAGRFAWGRAKYALADPVLVRAGMVLYCRYLPEDRFLLWWDHADLDADLDKSGPGRGMFPVRESLRMEIPPAWTPMPPLISLHDDESET